MRELKNFSVAEEFVELRPLVFIILFKTDQCRFRQGLNLSSGFGIPENDIEALSQ